MNENELDQLLKRAFLEQDFEHNRLHQETLHLVSKRVLTKPFWSPLFKLYRLNSLFLIISLGIFAISVLRLLHPATDSPFERELPRPITKNISNTNNHRFSPEPFTLAKRNSLSAKPIVPVVTAHPHSKKEILFSQQQIKKIPADSSSTFKDNVTVTELRTDSLAPSTLKVTQQVVDDSSSSYLKPSEKQLPGLKTASIKTKSKPKLDNTKTSKKGKIGKRGRGKRLGGNGTFILKGNKYRRSRHI